MSLEAEGYFPDSRIQAAADWLLDSKPDAAAGSEGEALVS